MPELDGGGCIYGLEYQCRALCSFNTADSEERASFLVGTQSIKADNQIHWLEYDEEGSIVRKKRVWIHSEGEIWQLSSCPSSSGDGLFLSVFTNAERKRCAQVWKLSSNPEEEQSLSRASQGMGPKEGDSSSDEEILSATWHPFESNKLISVSRNSLSIHDIQEDKSTPGPTSKKSMSFGSWNPHQNASTFATVHEHEIRGWDLRSNESVWRIESPGSHIVRSLDFNPNKQYYMASGGDDGRAHIWDVRMSDSSPLGSYDFGHSHWIWSIQFNQYHDQLLLTGGSDSLVALSSLSSLSSEPYGEEGEEGDKSLIEDGVIRIYRDHEDSVYRAEWSTVDPWTFASLSYDGRLVINQVPRGVKLKILNLV
uniref:TSSC1 n=1 Tax=Caligus rogercresseyi TaxID=217165 RepID=C1BQL0_CALRO|nr:TSSC1 [Caligus rogercresseyi]